jgi:large conductance mechanosensitive channel
MSVRRESSMLSEFKSFIARGNVVDLAIAVIMGAAFGAIVKTFTDGIIMPVVGLLTGGIDFKNKVINLGSMPVDTPDQISAAIAAKQPLILYGQLINDIITFLIVAFFMFLLAKYVVNLVKGLEPEEAPPSSEEKLLAEIRDILKAKS